MQQKDQIRGLALLMRNWAVPAATALSYTLTMYMQLLPSCDIDAF